MIRLAVRVRREDAEVALADLLSLAPAGVEEVDLPDEGLVEYAVYGAPGELPELPDLRAAAGGALVEVRTSEVGDDWAQRWRAFHRPVLVDHRLLVRAPWHEGAGGARRPARSRGPSRCATGCASASAARPTAGRRSCWWGRNWGRWATPTCTVTCCPASTTARRPWRSRWTTR